MPGSLIYQTIMLLSSVFHISGLTDFSTATHHTGNKTNMAIYMFREEGNYFLPGQGCSKQPVYDVGS